MVKSAPGYVNHKIFYSRGEKQVLNDRHTDVRWGYPAFKDPGVGQLDLGRASVKPVGNGKRTMKLSDLGSTDRTDRAVSPVIGVILMVAITVILAAVIGTFVLDLGQGAGQSAPQASFSVSPNSGEDNVTVRHTGGDGINAERTRVVIENTSNGDERTWDTGDPDTFSVGDEAVFNTSVSPGESPAGWSLSTGSGDAIDLKTDFQYEIRIIDTQSQKEIFRTEFTP